MNKVTLIGRLTADPELKETATGVPVTTFTLAVERKVNRKEIDWIDIVAWRGCAEFVCKYFTKGSPMVVEGSIQTRMWDDKNGQKRKSVEVHADSVEFVPRVKDTVTEAERPQNAVSIERRQVPFQTPKEVYSLNQSFSQGNDEDFQQVEINEDLPF